MIFLSGGRRSQKRQPACCAGYLAHPFAKSVVFYERMCQPTFRSFKKTKNRIVGRQGQASGGSCDARVADVKCEFERSIPREYGAVQYLQSIGTPSAWSACRWAC